MSTRTSTTFPVLVCAATTLNTGGTASITSAAVNTVQNKVKAHKATFNVRLGAIAGGGGLSVLKVQHCDTEGGTYADLTGATLGANPIADDDDNGYAQIDIDLIANPANAWLKLVATTAGAVDTVVSYAECVLSNFSINPPYDAGFKAIVRI